MLTRFAQLISENKKDYLLYYAFDWDDNILHMPTKIYLEKKVGDQWIPIKVSTSEYSIIRKDSVNYRLAENGYRDFLDNGSIFFNEVRQAISQGNFGPAWEDFIECLTHGCIFAIITARGHEPYVMREAVAWIIDNLLSEQQLYSMYNHLLMYSYKFNKDKVDLKNRILKEKPSQNELVKEYLENCDFIGIAAKSRGGKTTAHPEKPKEQALLEFNQKVNNYAASLGLKAKIGFSDDDLGTVKHVEDLIDNLNKERFPQIAEFVIKATKDPKNITKKVKVFETSHQTPGLESSVLKFTQFGNMAAQLNPQGPDQRQDDFANQFKRRTKYLSKTSNDILPKRKKIIRKEKKSTK